MFSQRIINLTVIRSFRRVTEEITTTFSHRLGHDYSVFMPIIDLVSNHFQHIPHLNSSHDIRTEWSQKNVPAYIDTILKSDYQICNSLCIDTEWLLSCLYNVIVSTMEKTRLLEEKQLQFVLSRDIFHTGHNDVTGVFIEIFEWFFLRRVLKILLNDLHQRSLKKTVFYSAEWGNLIWYFHDLAPQQLGVNSNQLFQTFTTLATLYQLTPAVFISYLLKKNLRNENSHFENIIKECGRNDQRRLNLTTCLQNETELPLKLAFNNSESQTLNNIFSRYFDFMMSRFRQR